MRPHAKAQTRTGRTVYYEVVRSKPRQPGDRHNQGGVRGRPILRNSTWMEVAHTRDARDLLKALAAFNKGVQKEKKTKSSAVRKSRRRS